MPPSTSLRSRIAAFEQGAVTNNAPDSPVLEADPNNVSRDCSKLLDVPISPSTSSKFPLLKPSASPSITPPRSRSESPDGLSVGTSVIDLSELEQPIQNPPQLPARPSSAASKSQTNPSSRDSTSSYDASRFSFEMASSRSTDSHVGSPLTSPPLPRKPPFLQGGSQSTSPPDSSKAVHNAQFSHDAGDSISSSWYKISPSSSPQFLDVHSALTAGSPRKSHGHALSTSSLQSVSLSSDGDAGEPAGSTSTPSVAETIAAFNNKASTPIMPQPIPEYSLPYIPRKNPRLRDSNATLPAFAVVGAKSAPLSPAKSTPPPLPARKPNLPARPFAASSASSSAQSVPSLSIRRVAPPPIYPPSISLRPTSSTSVMNTRVSSASSVERRKPPIPLGAHKRYEMLFDKNVERGSPSRTPLSSSGWRGADGLEDVSICGPRMSGAMVKSIWLCAKLPKGTLRQIWQDFLYLSCGICSNGTIRAGCDPDKAGSLDRDAFVRGMWAIDSELAKAAKVGARRQR